MHKHASSSAKRILLFFTIVFLITITDQLSKLWIRTHLTLRQSLPENGFFRLTYGQNTGAVFGIFQGNNDILAILVVIEAIIILVCLFFFRARYPFLDTRLNTVSLGLILGGLFGNLIDRIRLGYVTDFIGVGSWPDFNVADSSGVIGVIMLAFSILVFSRNR